MLTNLLDKSNFVTTTLHFNHILNQIKFMLKIYLKITYTKDKKDMVTLQPYLLNLNEYYLVNKIYYFWKNEILYLSNYSKNI